MLKLLSINNDSLLLDITESEKETGSDQVFFYDVHYRNGIVFHVP